MPFCDNTDCMNIFHDGERLECGLVNPNLTSKLTDYVNHLVCESFVESD